jgi:hypothetical protein
MTANETAARATAHAAATPMRELKDVARKIYNAALKSFRDDYRESYKMALGNPAWHAQLEDGFIKGFVTTRGTLHLGVAGLTVAEVNAHVNTTITFTNRKRNLTHLYGLYLEGCTAHIKAFDEAYELAMAENNHARNLEP